MTVRHRGCSASGTEVKTSSLATSRFTKRSASRKYFLRPRRPRFDSACANTENCQHATARRTEHWWSAGQDSEGCKLWAFMLEFKNSCSKAPDAMLVFRSIGGWPAQTETIIASVCRSLPERCLDLMRFTPRQAKGAWERYTRHA